MRVAFLGPEGTNSHEALLATVLGSSAEPVALGSNHDVVLAVQDGRVDRALAPLENSVEGGVNATVDALTIDAPDIVIVGEVVHAVHHCLVAAPGAQLPALHTVLSHGQGLAQCAGALRRLVPGARLEPVASTALAVERAAREPGIAAIGTRTAAAQYGADLLATDIEDQPDNATRFVWLAPAGTAPDGPPTKSSIVFHGAGDASPGWLVRCLSEFAFRGVNLTRIESRPLRSVLGHYLFHVDFDGAPGQPAVDAAIQALRVHCEAVRLLGAYPAAVSVEAVATLPGGHEGYRTS
ncbi:MAG: prephenate dehydratase [Actinomycetota bacterium]|nr:prephenate dehydratase [Actinomycetota bacterium]